MAATFFSSSQSSSKHQFCDCITFDVPVPLNGYAEPLYPFGEDLTASNVHPHFSAYDFLDDFLRSGNKHTRVHLRDKVLPQLLDFNKARVALVSLPRKTEQWLSYIPEDQSLAETELPKVKDEELKRRADIVIAEITEQTKLDRKTVLTAICQSSFSGVTTSVLFKAWPEILRGRVGFARFSGHYEVEIFESGRRVIINSQGINLTYNGGDISVLATANFSMEVIDGAVNSISFSLIDTNPLTIFLFSNETVKKHLQRDFSLVMHYYAAISGNKDSYEYFMRQPIILELTEEQRKLLTIQYFMSSENTEDADLLWQEIAPKEFSFHHVVYRAILSAYLCNLIYNSGNTGEERCQNLYRVLTQLIENTFINSDLRQILRGHLIDLRCEMRNPKTEMVVSDNIGLRSSIRPAKANIHLEGVFRNIITLIVNNNLTQFSDDLRNSLIEKKQLIKHCDEQQHKESGLQPKKMCVLL